MNWSHSAVLARVLALSALGLFATAGLAQTQKTEQAAADAPPVYKPPVRGAPASRVGGGSRSVGTEIARVYVLAPPDIGFTTKAKPDLFWFVPEATGAKVFLTVYTDDPNKPLLEQALPAVTSPGIQRVKLSDFGLELQQRVEYRWRISLVSDSENRQARAIAAGAIQRTNPWPKLQTRLQNQDALGRAHVYAEEGLWYDALEMLAESAEANRADPRVRRQRAALLDQVGLTEPSQFEAAGK